MCVDCGIYIYSVNVNNLRVWFVFGFYVRFKYRRCYIVGLKKDIVFWSKVKVVI